MFDYGLKQIIGFWAGIIGLILILICPEPDGLHPAAWTTAAVGILMAIWWITEALPIAATSLLPVVLFPLLGVQSISDTTSPYANPLIFLFMGGFMLAIAMQRWHLHKRIALNIVHFVGTKPRSILIGFIIASALLSMWVSNTATALMMLPIALSIIEIADSPDTDSQSVDSNFSLVLLLCIAYSCNIGGIGTLIGTPPNALVAGYMLDTYGHEISFLQWMMVGVPIVIIGLPLMYLLLTRVVYPVRRTQIPGGDLLIRKELDALGEITRPELRVMIIFGITALLWISRTSLNSFIPGLTDSGIAIAAGISLFIIPADWSKKEFLLQWEQVRELPWGVLILFGGGLSLASAISSTGLADWLGQEFSTLAYLTAFTTFIVIVTLIVFLTEMTSNTATTAAFIPILGSAAVGLGQDPILFVVPAAIAASCAFMLPVATPPNAIVYASEKVTIVQMTKSGLWMNILFILFITMVSYTILPWAFGI